MPRKQKCAMGFGLPSGATTVEARADAAAAYCTNLRRGRCTRGAEGRPYCGYHQIAGSILIRVECTVHVLQQHYIYIYRVHLNVGLVL